MKNTEIQPKYKVGQIIKYWNGFDLGVDDLLITEIDLYKGLYSVLNLSDVMAKNNRTKYYKLYFDELENGARGPANILNYA